MTKPEYWDCEDFFTLQIFSISPYLFVQSHKVLVL
jgi:hypothetical protein